MILSPHTPRRPARNSALPPLPRRDHRHPKSSCLILSSAKRRKIRHHPIDFASISQFTLLKPMRPPTRLLSFDSSPSTTSDPVFVSSPLDRHSSRKGCAYMHPYAASIAPKTPARTHNDHLPATQLLYRCTPELSTPVSTARQEHASPISSPAPMFDAGSRSDLALDLFLQRDDPATSVDIEDSEATLNPLFYSPTQVLSSISLYSKESAYQSTFNRLHLASSSPSSTPPNRMFPGMSCPLYPFIRNRNSVDNASAPDWNLDVTQ